MFLHDRIYLWFWLILTVALFLFISMVLFDIFWWFYFRCWGIFRSKWVSVLYFHSFFFTGWLNTIYPGWVEMFKCSRAVTMRFFLSFTLKLNFVFVIWIFLELSILENSGRIGDICNPPVMVLVTTEDLNSVDIFVAAVRVSLCGLFL